MGGKLIQIYMFRNFFLHWSTNQNGSVLLQGADPSVFPFACKSVNFQLPLSCLHFSLPASEIANSQDQSF